MTAAVIKFNALADPVGSTPKNHNFFTVAWARFAFYFAHHRGFIGRIHIGSLRFKLSCTGVDTLKHCRYPVLVPRMPHIRLTPVCKGCKACIGKAQHFERAQRGLICGQPILLDLALSIDNFANSGQKPRIEFCHRMDFGITQAVPHCLRDCAQAVGSLLADCLNNCRFIRCANDVNLIETGKASFH